MFLIGQSAGFIPYLMFAVLTILLAGKASKDSDAPLINAPDKTSLSLGAHSAYEISGTDYATVFVCEQPIVTTTLPKSFEEEKPQNKHPLLRQQLTAMTLGLRGPPAA